MPILRIVYFRCLGKQFLCNLTLRTQFENRRCTEIGYPYIMLTVDS